MSTIEPLGPADLAETVALWRACGLTRPWNDPAHDFTTAVGGAGSAVLGWRDPHVAGSVMVGHDGHRGWFYYLAVEPGRRGEGRGRALVRAAEAWLVARGMRKVQLMLRDGNDAGGFYRRLGYETQPVAVWGKWLEGTDRDGRSDSAEGSTP